MTLLDVSIVNVALPSIEADLQAGPQEIQWIVAGYALTFGLTLVAAGRAGDIFGRRKLFLIGLAGFVLASAGCGFATGDAMLAVMRLVQGLFAGILNPQILGMMQDMFRGPARARAFGIFGIVVGVSTAIGPALGGALISTAPQWGWRLVFLINLPIGLVVIPLAARFLPKSAPTLVPGRSILRQFDIAGVFLVGITVLLVMFPFLDSSEGSGGTTRAGLLGGSPYWLLGVAVIFMILTYLWEKYAYNRGGEVLLDPRLVHNPSFMYGVATSFFYFAGFTSIFITTTLYLQQGNHWSPWHAGLAAVPFALVSGTSSGVSGRLVNRYGRAVPIIGALIVSLGSLALAACALWVPMPSQPFAVIAAMTVAGIGSGLLISPNQALTLEHVPREAAGTAAALLQTFQRLGAAIGLAVVTSIFFRAVKGTGDHAGYSWAMAMAGITIAAVVFLAFLSSLADALRRRHEHANPEGMDAA